MTQLEAERKVVELKNAYNERRKTIDDEYRNKMIKAGVAHDEDIMWFNAGIKNCIIEISKTEDPSEKARLEAAMKEYKLEIHRKEQTHRTDMMLLRVEHGNVVRYEKNKMKNAISELMTQVDERGGRYWQAKYEELKAQTNGAV